MSMPSDTGRDNAGPVVRPEGSERFVLSCPREMEWRARLDLVDLLRHATHGQPSFSELIVSLAGVTYINSAGLGAVFSLRRHVISSSARMVLCDANPTIRRLLETVDMSALIPVVDDIDAARSFLEQEREQKQDSTSE